MAVNSPSGRGNARLFLRNLGMYFWMFLPAATLAGMAYRAVFNQPAVAPEWDPGWNPILWLIMSVPWLLPTVLAVPVLHVTANHLVRGPWKRTVRGLLMAAAPLLFLLILLGLWGSSYLELHLLLPMLLGAWAYGALFRIPQEPAESSENS